MAALIIAIFPQNSSRGNWEEQQDRTDPNSQFELARKPAWLLAFRQFGLPKWKHDFECGPFSHLGTSPYVGLFFAAQLGKEIFHQLAATLLVNRTHNVYIMVKSRKLQQIELASC